MQYTANAGRALKTHKVSPYYQKTISIKNFLPYTKFFHITYVRCKQPAINTTTTTTTTATTNTLLFPIFTSRSWSCSRYIAQSIYCATLNSPTPDSLVCVFDRFFRQCRIRATVVNNCGGKTAKSEKCQLLFELVEESKLVN